MATICDHQVASMEDNHVANLWWACIRLWVLYIGQIWTSSNHYSKTMKYYSSCGFYLHSIFQFNLVFYFNPSWFVPWSISSSFCLGSLPRCIIVMVSISKWKYMHCISGLHSFKTKFVSLTLDLMKNRWEKIDLRNPTFIVLPPIMDIPIWNWQTWLNCIE